MGTHLPKLDGEHVETLISKKTNHNQRSFKGNTGLIVVNVKNMKANQETAIFNGYKLRPGMPLSCSWSFPSTLTGKKLSIGLFRYGCQTNEGSLITKSIEFSSDNFAGTTKFFAPKSAGEFIFRAFDTTTKESSCETLTISTMFSVVLMDTDILSNLNHVITAFDENSPHKALGLLQIIIKHIKSNSTDPVDIVRLLNDVVMRMFLLLQNSMNIVDDGYRRRQATKLRKRTESEIEGDEVGDDADKAEEDGDSEFWKNYRSSIKLHAECYEAFYQLKWHKTPWYWISERQKIAINKQNELFCLFLKRYFTDELHREEARRDFLGFQPFEYVSLKDHSNLVIMSKLFESKASSFMPTSQFDRLRFEVKEKIQGKLLQHGFFNENQQLVVYGSSANGFGNPSSDIDLCLKDNKPAGTSVDRLKIMCRLADALSELKMLDVKPLLTARVPIIEFSDPDSGLSCDVAYHNALALANTAMLRVYSQIDFRVREMVYLVKNWVKCRGINSPQQGTLGSYGYVLTVIHFLQVKHLTKIFSLIVL